MCPKPLSSLFRVYRVTILLPLKEGQVLLALYINLMMKTKFFLSLKCWPHGLLRANTNAECLLYSDDILVLPFSIFTLPIIIGASLTVLSVYFCFDYYGQLSCL